MSEMPNQSGPPQIDELQFTTVEPAAAGAQQRVQGPACIACHQPIVNTYFAVGDKLICPGCRDRYAASISSGSKLGRLARATFFGIIGGLIGALIWFAVARITNREFGLIALVVGLLVGGAVRAGSRGHGGRGYQILAVVLTYCAIAANYVPDIFEALYHQYQEKHAAVAQKDGSDVTTSPTPHEGGRALSGSAKPAESSVPKAHKPIGPVAAVLLLILLVLVVFAFALAAPFLAGIHNLIGLFIIGFALWEAWKINARRPVTFAGPYSLTSGASGLPAASGGQP